jgi:hypothetical protein
VPNTPGAAKTEQMVEEHGACNLHDRSTGYSESQMPHQDQEGHPEAFADSWHSATAPRKRATPAPYPLCHFNIYFVKKGK